MPISNFTGGFKHGVSVQNMPVLNTYGGNVYWVDSNGPGGGRGTFPRPVPTLNAAMNLCTANNGDIVMVKPGHVEDIADTSTSGALDMDVAGVSIIGLGTGSLVPRIDFNHADSDFLIGANNITVENIHFEATVNGVKLGIAIEAAVTGTTIRGCKFTVETTTTVEFLNTIQLLAGCDDTTIVGCHIDMGLGGATNGIKLTGASNNVKIVENLIVGDYASANITGDTTLSTEVLIKDNILISGSSIGIGTEPVIEMLTGTSGYVIGNDILCDVATAALMAIGDAMFFSRNYVQDSVGESVGASIRTTGASVSVFADG